MARIGSRRARAASLVRLEKRCSPRGCLLQAGLAGVDDGIEVRSSKVSMAILFKRPSRRCHHLANGIGRHFVTSGRRSQPASHNEYLSTRTAEDPSRSQLPSADCGKAPSSSSARFRDLSPQASFSNADIHQWTQTWNKTHHGPPAAQRAGQITASYYIAPRENRSERRNDDCFRKLQWTFRDQ